LDITPPEKDQFQVLQKTNVIPPTLETRYARLHEALSKAEEMEYLCVNGFAPTDPRRRHEFITELKVPCKAVLYTHSGSGPLHLHFIWKISVFLEETEILNKAHSVSQEIAKTLPVYHTRAMRREFVSSFGLATNCSAAFLRQAYNRLTGDHSAADSSKQAEVDSRIAQILDEEDPDLIWDHRT
jgi:hypothetical protein